MLRTLRRLAADWLVPLLVLGMVLTILVWLFRPPPRRAVPPRTARQPRRAAPTSAPPAAEGYLFCSWNVENLFDDQDDPNSHDAVEDWSGTHPEVVRDKVSHLADALLLQGEGRGPDLLTVVEVESRRAVELLRDELNRRLPTELRYNYVAHRDNRTGRRIEPAVLSRLPLADEPADAGDFGIRRILRTRVVADGQPLVLIVSHWTSRVTDHEGGKRAAYADVLYRAFQAEARVDPGVDLLLAGDYNDEPTDPSLVDHLHAVGDAARVINAARGPEPMLLDLVANFDPKLDGTYLYGKRWQIFDHIIVSPGLLDDEGWYVLPETTRTAHFPQLRSNRDQRPFRYGGPEGREPRGYSDHFAVTVRLRVASPAPVH